MDKSASGKESDMPKDKKLTPAEEAAKRREEAARKRKAQRERTQAAEKSKKRAKETAKRREAAIKKRKQTAQRSQARRDQLREAEGVDTKSSKPAQKGGARLMSAAQRAAEKAKKRKEARQQAVERAARRAQRRSKAKQQAAGKDVATKKPASAAQRAAAKSQRRQARRVGQRHRAAGVPQKAAPTTDDVALTEKFDELETKFETLYKAALLSEVSDDLEDTDSALAALPVTLETLRSRGYAFKSFLEKKITVLQEQWDDLEERVLDGVDSRSEELIKETDKAAALLDQARARSGSSAKRQLDRCESALTRLESKVDAAQQALEGMYDTLDNNVDQTQRQLEAIAWALDQVDEASFRLYPAEAVVAACEAQLLERGDDEGPKGIFYLTDERVLFEQKEEVATKKVLFVTTEKKKVQELRFKVPIGNVEEMKATDKGTIRHKELLELNFGGDASLRRAHLRLLGGADSEEWQGFIGRVVSGDIAQERVAPKDEAAVEAARAAPTVCPTCGAQFTQAIVRGMQEITCEYCGASVRL
jgi:hypothetical protein